MKKKGIKNLIFDFGGILVNLNRQKCIENFRKLGVENIQEFISILSPQGMFMKFEKGEITSSEFRTQIREITNNNLLTDNAIDSAWNSFLEDIPTYKLEALLKLREKYVVYLLSNTNEIHWEWSVDKLFPYKSFRIKDYFEDIFLSYELNLVKPDPVIYQCVLENTGINPEETLFIDDLAENCIAAESVGIHTYNAQPREDWRHLFL